jgi:hypothetical protein
MMSSHDHYYDDPIPDLPAKKPLNKNRVFGLILSFVAAGVFINSTFAGNISLNSGGAVEFGQGVLAATACDGSFTVKPGSSYSNSAGNFKLSSVEITNLDSSVNGCAGKALTLNFYGDTSTVSLGSIVIADGGSSFSSNSGSITASGYGTTNTSLTLTLTSPAIVSTSVFKVTVESALSSCATGGVCNVGDTGPGGGIVFYKAVSAFACGPTRSNSCYYLEAAPATWSGLANGDADLSIAWSGNTTQTVGTGGGDTATATAIGWGYRNTLAAVAQSGTANKAITVARAYNGGGLNDWFLPAKDELAQLYSRKLTVGGFVGMSYLSSSEFSATNIYRQDFSNGNVWNDSKGSADHVRPIRAF